MSRLTARLWLGLSLMMYAVGCQGEVINLQSPPFAAAEIDNSGTTVLSSLMRGIVNLPNIRNSFRNLGLFANHRQHQQPRGPHFSHNVGVSI